MRSHPKKWHLLIPDAAPRGDFLYAQNLDSVCQQTYFCIYLPMHNILQISLIEWWQIRVFKINIFNHEVQYSTVQVCVSWPTWYLLSGSSPGKGWTSSSTFKVFSEGCLLLVRVVTWTDVMVIGHKGAVVRAVNEASQSLHRGLRRLLLEPSPCWKRLLSLFRHYAKHAWKQ